MYQRPFWRALFLEGKTRLVRVCHRRFGKDLDCLSAVIAMACVRVGTYLYGLPEYGQAEAIIWEGIDNDGIPFMDRIPPEILKAKHETKLRATLVNGSIIQLVGTDRFDKSLVGRNPVCYVGSEHAIADPAAWEFTRPILEENNGIAIFPYTPRGKSHGYDLYEVARKNHVKPGSRWFCEKQTILDTARWRPPGGPKTREDVNRIIEEEGMDPEIAEQDYFCSFEGSMSGSFYGELVDEAEREGRFARVPWQRGVPVHTFWDLGMGDETVIIFTQELSHETHVIDFYENRGKALDHYAKVVRDKPYVYGQHYAPHDAKVRDLGTGYSRELTMGGLGVRWLVNGKAPLADGISAVRRHFRRLWVDQANAGEVIDSMREYRKKWSKAVREYTSEPVHDKHSHRMDALRTWAMSGQVGRTGDPEARRPVNAETDFDVMADNFGRPAPEDFEVMAI